MSDSADLEHDPLLKKVRGLMDAYIYPLENRWSGRRFSDLLPGLNEARQAVRDEGLLAPHVPRVWGGAGLSLTTFARVSEELGRSPLGHFAFNCQAPDAGNMELLLLHGSEEHKRTYLRPLVRGEVRSCFSMTEPDLPGSNPTWLNTTARREGDSYVIDGRKWFTTGAEGATFAIVMAVSNPEAAPHRRASLILVPTDCPGFRIVRNISVMGDPGDDHASHAEVQYDACRVPVANRIGDEGEGFALAQKRLGPGRIHHCMRWIGICERAFELMCRRAANRPITPERRLGELGTVANWVAESRAEINAARLMVLEAATVIEKQGAKTARDNIALVKFFAAGVLQRVLDRSIQVHGALGLTDDLPLAYWFRHERAARIYDGPDEVHKAAVAARILRRFKDAE